MQRFWDKVKKLTYPSIGCWVWTGAVRKGCGVFRLENLLIQADRFAYELQRGKIPNGARVLANCDNPLCVKGSHLSIETSQPELTPKPKATKKKKTTTVSAETAWCCGCKEFLPIDNFHKNKYSYNGLHNRCRFCRSEQWKEKNQRRLESNQLKAI